jgi:hypothetical protein
MSTKSIIALCVWVFMSFLVPLGILGDVIYRKMFNIKLKKKWWTYFVSMIPLLGPIISYVVLHD